MESIKKILPYLLIAIIFAVGGYFIGKGSANNQGASFYTATTTTSSSIAKPKDLGTTGPTGGDSGPADLVAFGGSGTAPAWMPALLCDLLGGKRRNHVTNLGGGNYQYDYIGCLFGELAVNGNDIYSYASNVAKKNAAMKPAISVK